MNKKIVKIQLRKKDKIVLFLVGILILTYDVLLGVKYLFTPYYLPGDAYSYYIFVLTYQGYTNITFQPTYFVENIVLPSIISQALKPYIVFGYFAMNFFFQLIGITLIYRGLKALGTDQMYIKFFTILSFLFLFTIPPPESEKIYLQIYRVFSDLWGYEYYKLYAIFTTLLVVYLIFRRNATLSNEVAPIFIASLIFFYPHYGILLYLVDLVLFGRNTKILIYSLVEVLILYITNVISGLLLLLSIVVLIAVFFANYNLQKITVLLLNRIMNTFKSTKNIIFFSLTLMLFLVDFVLYFSFSSVKEVGIVDPSTWLYIDLPIILMMTTWTNINTNEKSQHSYQNYLIILIMILQISIYTLSNIPVTFVQTEAFNPWRATSLYYILIVMMIVLNRSIPKNYVILYVILLTTLMIINWIMYYIRYLSYFPTLGNSSVNLDIAKNIIVPSNDTYYIATKDFTLWHLFLFINPSSLVIHASAYNQNLTLLLQLIQKSDCFNIATINKYYIFFSMNHHKCHDYVIIGYGTLADNVLHSEPPIVVVISNNTLLHIRNHPIVKLDNMTRVIYQDGLYIIEAKNFNVLGYRPAFAYGLELFLFTFLHLLILLFLTFLALI
ncbi:MAG: hypothetical protein ACO2OY_09600 [Thermodesulfobacteriaceae bacterium]|jgi:hypothetical protein